jgi:hypothetical protein
MEYRMDLHQNPYPAGCVGDFRVFVANNYVYEQIAIGKSELAKGAVRERFFNSLHINAAAQPTAASIAKTAAGK